MPGQQFIGRGGGIGHGAAGGQLAKVAAVPVDGKQARPETLLAGRRLAVARIEYQALFVDPFDVAHVDVAELRHDLDAVIEQVDDGQAVALVGAIDCHGQVACLGREYGAAEFGVGKEGGQRRGRGLRARVHGDEEDGREGGAQELCAGHMGSWGSGGGDMLE